MKSSIKFIWVVLINILLIVYLLEFLSIIFLPSKTDMYLDLDLLRYKIAKERGVPFDQRTYYQAFFEEKDEEPMLSPRYQFTSAYWSPILYGPNNPFQKYIKSKIENKKLIPLRGPVNKKTLSCRENGTRKIANNDKHGFKNLNSIYDKKIKVFLIGDSFTHGECEDENTDIAGLLRNNSKINTANYGISGAGPLLSLAALAEYGSYYKPDFTIYLYSEANDMQDLTNEKNTFLVNYLKNYKQNLISGNNEILEFFRGYEKIAYEFLNKKLKTEPTKFDENIEEKIIKSEKKKFIEIAKDFFELQKLKSIFLSRTFYLNNDNTIDEKLFSEVLSKMQSITAGWNGKFIVVYLPDWNRFNSKYSLVKFLHKRKIENIVKSLNITYIDIVKEFEKNDEPINYYPFGLRGHYTIEGYEVIADAIYKNVVN